MNKKDEAALLEQDDPKGNLTANILPQFDGAVKRNDLRAIMELTELRSRDAAKLLRQQFPSFDKPTLAKCCRPEKYGCVLHPDGYTLLRGLIPGAPEASEAPEAQAEVTKPKKRDGHKLMCRIYGRLPDNKWLRLRRAIEADGYATVQDWIATQVDEYLEKKEKEHGSKESA